MMAVSRSFGALWLAALLTGAASFAIVLALTQPESYPDPLAPENISEYDKPDPPVLVGLPAPALRPSVPEPVPAVRPQPPAAAPDQQIAALPEPPPFSTEVVPSPPEAAPPTPKGRAVDPSSSSFPPVTIEQTETPRKSYTVKSRLAEIGPGATGRLKEKFEAAKVSWPPHEITLIGLKDERILELYARPRFGRWQLVHRYPVLGASGVNGPKLKQGDKQVPEGIYGIKLLNPNSKYHVSLRVSYPNEFDRAMAKNDGRTDLGGDIMIHGKNVSVGCLAIGDEAAEEIFVLADKVGLKRIKVIIAPSDLRLAPPPDPPEGAPKWVPDLYKKVATAMSDYTTAETQTAKAGWKWKWW